MKKITDKEFEDKWNNLEIQKLMGKAVSRFAGIIENEELEGCKQRALWKFLMNYDDSNTKLSTYLTLRIRWECLDFLTQQNRQVKNILYTSETNGSYSKTLDEVIFDLDLSDDDKDILLNKYVYKYTIKEICQNKGINKNRINKAVRNLKNKIKERINR